jgi:hypothetical protein
MNFSERNDLSMQVYYRLVALWIICEAMLGSIIHALHIPVSGLLVGSAAVICICLIAWYCPGRGNILRATLIVAIFKMMLSPHAPPAAYFAVFFQGLMGETIFLFGKRFYKTLCMVFAVLALAESGLQRLIVMTIVYGTRFWTAVNDFIGGLSGDNTPANFSLYLAIAYVVAHICMGLLVGWWAGIIPERVSDWREEENRSSRGRNFKAALPSTKRTKRNWGVITIWILLVLTWVQSHFHIGRPWLPPSLTIEILLRSLIIILSWYILIAPGISTLLKRWLEKKKNRFQNEVHHILQLLPEMRAIVNLGWQQAAGRRGFKKIGTFCRLVIAEVLIEFE